MLESEFNSDIYAIESWLDLNKKRPKDSLILAKVSDRDPQIAIDNVLRAIEENKETVGIVSMSLVSSHFSHYYEISNIRESCRRYGVLLFIDLAHALGAVPLNITELDVDCAYLSSSKYLSSGPGCVGGIFINSRHRGIVPGLRGWFGTDRNMLTS